jgi:hypothetical protein
MVKEIVISAYDKPLDWIKEISPEIKITIYRKGNVVPIQKNEISLNPNRGRCVHTFFNHIYLNYENLSDYTFFVQDFPFDHWGNLLEVLNSDISEIDNNASLIIDGYFGFHNNNIGTAWKMNPSNQFGGGFVLSCQSNGFPQDLSSNINVNQYWSILFSDVHTPPNQYEFIPGGHFVITKEQAWVRSKEFYKKIVEFLLENENSPWIIERLECYIFNKNFETIL